MDANVEGTVSETLSSIIAEQSSNEGQEVKNLSSKSFAMAESCEDLISLDDSTASSNRVDLSVGVGKETDNKGSLHDSTCISTNKACVKKEEMSTASQEGLSTCSTANQDNGETQQSNTGKISQPSTIPFQTNGPPISEPTIDENKRDFWPSTAVGTSSMSQASDEKQIEVSEQPSGTPSDLIKANIVEEIEMAVLPSTPRCPVNSNLPQAFFDDKKESVKSGSGSLSPKSGDDVEKLVDIVALKMKFTPPEFRQQNKSNVKNIVSAFNKTYSSTPCLSPSGEETNPCKKSPVIQKATSSPVLPIIKITEADDVEEENRLTKNKDPVECGVEAGDGVMEETTGISSTLESVENTETAKEIEIARELGSSEKIKSNTVVKHVEKPRILEISETIKRRTEVIKLIETTRKQKVSDMTKRDPEIVKDAEKKLKLESSKPDESNPETGETLQNSKAVEEKNTKASDSSSRTQENESPEYKEDGHKAFFYKSPSEIPPEFRYQTLATSSENSNWTPKKMEQVSCLGFRSFHGGIVACCIVVALIGFSIYQLALDGKMSEVYEIIGLSFTAIAFVIGVLSILYISAQMCFPNAPSSLHQMVDVEIASSMNQTLYPEDYEITEESTEVEDIPLGTTTDLETTAEASNTQPKEPIADVRPDDTSTALDNSQRVKSEATVILQTSSDVMSSQTCSNTEVDISPSESERNTISKKDD